VEAKTLRNTLAEVKAKELVDNLADWPTEVETKTQSEHLLM